MEKDHHYLVSWNTRTRYTTRHYSRKYTSEADAVRKAREMAARPLSEFVRVMEMESWETPDGVNGTLHVSFLGFIPYWED